MPVVNNKRTHVFSIDFHSAQDEKRYLGNFTTKKMSIRDTVAVGVRKAQLNAGMYYDPERPGKGVDAQTDMLNHWIAQLEISIVSAPDWWKLDEITDFGLLEEVYKEVVSFENTFLERGERAANSRASSQEGSSSDQESSDSARGTRTVVDAKVQAALEP